MSELVKLPSGLSIRVCYRFPGPEKMSESSEKPAPIHLTRDTIASEMFQAGLEIGWKQGVSDASIPSSPRYEDARRYLWSLLARMEGDA